MRGKRLLVFLLLGFLVISSLNAIQRRNYRAGWIAGYNIGQAEAATPSGEAAPATPAPPNSYDGYAPQHHHVSPLGWFFGGLLRFFLFLFMLGLFLKVLSCIFWRRRWRHRHHWGDGPRWRNQDWSGSSVKEKRPEDVEPDIQTH